LDFSLKIPLTTLKRLTQTPLALQKKKEKKASSVSVLIRTTCTRLSGHLGQHGGIAGTEKSLYEKPA